MPKSEEGNEFEEVQPDDVYSTIDLVFVIACYALLYILQLGVILAGIFILLRLNKLKAARP